MNLQMHRRLRTLEQRGAIAAVCWRRVICATEAEAGAARAAEKASEDLITKLLVATGY